MTEFTPLLEDSTRGVGTRTRPEGDYHVVTLARTFATTINDAWDAVTNPERIPRWFVPISGDLRVGGRFQLEGNAGGTVERCEPPHALTTTWEFGEQVSWIEATLAAQEDGTTRLTLEHIVPDDDHWRQYGPGAVGIGWDLGLLGLILHLEGEASLAPDEAMAWMMSEDGGRFMTSSNHAWAEADLASGEEPGQARAAASRTLAFYTGTESPAEA